MREYRLEDLTKAELVYLVKRRTLYSQKDIVWARWECTTARAIDYGKRAIAERNHVKSMQLTRRGLTAGKVADRLYNFHRQLSGLPPLKTR